MLPGLVIFLGVFSGQFIIEYTYVCVNKPSHDFILILPIQIKTTQYLLIITVTPLFHYENPDSQGLRG